MKKTYLQPELLIVNVKLDGSILEGSLEKVETTVDDTDGGWTKEDKGWDIWGDDME